MNECEFKEWISMRWFIESALRKLDIKKCWVRDFLTVPEWVLNSERHSWSVTHPLLSCAGSEESGTQLHVVIAVVFAGAGHLLPLLPQLILRRPLLLDSLSEILLWETEIRFMQNNRGTFFSFCWTYKLCVHSPGDDCAPDLYGLYPWAGRVSYGPPPSVKQNSEH